MHWSMMCLGGPGDPTHAMRTHCTPVWNHQKPCWQLRSMASWGLCHTRTLPAARNNWYHESLENTTRFLSSEVQLAISQAQMRGCVQCLGVNRDTLVGLLLPYPMEAKERWTDLQDMRVGLVMSSMMYSRDTMDWGMLNASTILESECPIRLEPPALPR